MVLASTQLSTGPMTQGPGAGAVTLSAHWRSHSPSCSTLSSFAIPVADSLLAIMMTVGLLRAYFKGRWLRRAFVRLTRTDLSTSPFPNRLGDDDPTIVQADHHDAQRPCSRLWYTVRATSASSLSISADSFKLSSSCPSISIEFSRGSSSATRGE